MSDTTRKRILVIDDDVDLLSTLGDFLRFEGFQVDTADNGEEGLRKMSEARPDLIILDMSMPGMGGIAVLNEMAGIESVKGVPVYIFTARANMQDFFSDVDVAGFMAKPCDPGQLLREIHKVLATMTVTRAAPSVTPGRKKILLAENEASLRESMVDAFVDAGFDVVPVTKGPEVVETAIVEKPTIVVLKLVMENMNGDAAAAMLREIPSTRNIPIVLYDDTHSVPKDLPMWEEGRANRRFVRGSKPGDIVRAVRSLMV